MDPIFNIEEKVIAVIGATGLLGTQYTELFVSRGAKVVVGDYLYDRCVTACNKLKRDYPQADVLPVKIDVTNEKDIEIFLGSPVKSCV